MKVGLLLFIGVCILNNLRQLVEYYFSQGLIKPVLIMQFAQNLHKLRMTEKPTNINSTRCLPLLPLATASILTKQRSSGIGQHPTASPTIPCLDLYHSVLYLISLTAKQGDKCFYEKI